MILTIRVTVNLK